MDADMVYKKNYYIWPVYESSNNFVTAWKKQQFTPPMVGFWAMSIYYLLLYYINFNVCELVQQIEDKI